MKNCVIKLLKWFQEEDVMIKAQVVKNHQLLMEVIEWWMVF